MSKSFARIIGCAVVFTTPSNALIFDSDDRAFALPQDKRFQAIGIVKSAFGYGTGFLVDDCHVLTSRHLQSDQGNFHGASLSFISSNKAIGSKRGQAVAWGPPGLAEKGQTSRDRTGDWLLFKLDQCVGQLLGFVALAGEVPDPALKLMNAGYPIDRGRRAGLTVDPSCRIYFITQNGSLHDCAFLPGNSGGPIFATAFEGGHPMLDAVAIGSAGYRKPNVIAYDPNNSNVATPIVPILPVLRRYLRPVFHGTDRSDDFTGSGLFDRLEGGGGEDKFHLDKWGGDTIVGGQGSDRYLVDTASGSGHFLADFNADEGDVLDLSAFDGDRATPGIQPVALVSPASRASNTGGSATIDCDLISQRTTVRLTARPRDPTTPWISVKIVLNGCPMAGAIVGSSKTF